MFHVSVGAANASPPSSSKTRVFGVPLEDLRSLNNGDPVPDVLKMCVHAIEERGEPIIIYYKLIVCTNFLSHSHSHTHTYIHIHTHTHTLTLTQTQTQTARYGCYWHISSCS